MKITNNLTSTNASFKKHPINTTITRKNYEVTHNIHYNPIYYKPIAFKGSDFGIYFPEKILKMSEKEFDEMLLNVLETPAKRNALAEYITSQVAKDNQTMNFINMWKKQVPTLISQGLISTMPANSTDFFRRIGSLTARNNANSTYTKFKNSDFQDSIIWKDTKSAGAGVLSWQLFTWANADPEPVTKVALYATAFIVGAIGYNERNKDTKKIQNKQFVNSVKEMMKLGALDPYLLITYIDKNKLNLTPKDKESYVEWQNSRIKDIRYQNTGTTVDKHNDFSTPEAQRALIMFIKMLQEDLGFDDEKIAALLQLYAAKYDSVGGSQEAEYLTRMAIEIYNTLKLNKPMMTAYETLGYLCLKNEKPLEALNAFQEVKVYASLEPEITKENSLRAQMNILEIKQNLIKKTSNLRKLIIEDYEISKTKERKDSLHNFRYKNIINMDYDEYDKKEYETISNELTAAIAGAEYAKISDEDLKLLLRTVSKMPLPDIKFAPQDKATYDNEYGVTSTVNCEDETEIIQAQITKSNKYIQERLKNFEQELIKNDAYENMNYREKAELIVGTNVIKGTLEDLITSILIKEYNKYTKTDAEILKILSDNLYKGGCEDFNYITEGYDPLYLKLLQARMYSFNYIYGEDTEEVIRAAADYGMRDKNPYRLIYQVIPAIKNSSQSLQDELLPDLYARYAKYKEMQVYELGNTTINQKEALNIIAGYVKYFDKAKIFDENKILDFLKFLEKIYKNKPTETTETSWYGTYNSAPVFDVPLFDEIDSYENELNKVSKFLDWRSTDIGNPIEPIIKKSPGLFRINERKFIDMTKQFQNVFFQKKFNEEMDNKMKQIEKNIGLPEDLIKRSIL